MRENSCIRAQRHVSAAKVLFTSLLRIINDIVYIVAEITMLES